MTIKKIKMTLMMKGILGIVCDVTAMLALSLGAPLSLPLPIPLALPPLPSLRLPSTARSHPASMQSSMGESGVNDAEMGNTYWASWREEQGVSEDGQFPAGEDMVEKELKRMFNLDETTGSFSTQEIDDVQVHASVMRSSEMTLISLPSLLCCS